MTRVQGRGKLSGLRWLAKGKEGKNLINKKLWVCSAFEGFSVKDIKIHVKRNVEKTAVAGGTQSTASSDSPILFPYFMD